MLRTRFTSKAILDLDQIWDYSFEMWSEEQADMYYDELMSACRLIASFPNLGRSYRGVMDGILGYGEGKHIIFYTFTDTELLIIRILHQHMDLPSKIKE